MKRIQLALIACLSVLFLSVGVAAATATVNDYYCTFGGTPKLTRGSPTGANCVKNGKVTGVAFQYVEDFHCSKGGTPRMSYETFMVRCFGDGKDKGAAEYRPGSRNDKPPASAPPNGRPVEPPTGVRPGCYVSGDKVAAEYCSNAIFVNYFKKNGKQDDNKCYVLVVTAGGSGVTEADCTTFTVGRPFTGVAGYNPRNCTKDPPFDTQAKILTCVTEEYVKCEKLSDKAKVDACKKLVGTPPAATPATPPATPPAPPTNKAPPAGIVKLGTFEELSLPNVDDTTFLGKVIPVVYFLAGSIGVLVVLSGGLRYVMSAGSPEKITAAKNTIIYGSVGLALVFLVPLIIRVVIGFLKGVFG